MGQVKRERRRKRIREGAGEVPTSSFADIAFLLIIYFMIVTTLIQTKGLTADMPAGQKSEAADTEDTPMVTVIDNRIMFNDEATTAEQLRSQLRALELATKPPEERIVMLEAAGHTDYQVFYEAVAAINAAGGVIADVQDADTGEEGGD